ncbi:MAG: hypothetical protein OEU90_00745 [Gammaproteobacteria bacterium]|jgi:hypothetical protein|nr:hypothetical protein [Gammaproteobacteria bacterium]MDH3752160.1 hypothetical protein [Gammaproteobacteria bacterium]MDH3803975.1 hypothetical protein [Gammaproteobacteria bacterium]
MQPANDVKPPAPIFLICSERSGSNLISSIVGEHPEDYAHPPYHLGGDLTDRFGYPREYTGLARPGFFSSLRPQLTEPLERFINSDMHPQYNFGNRRLKKQLEAHVAPLCPPLWEGMGKSSSD